MFAESSKSAAKDLSSRVSFQRHDFFTAQSPAAGISAYLLRQCLHNWSDEDSVKIIKTFIPALEASPETALLINEGIMPNRGDVALHEERMFRQMDLAMFVTTNAKQRTEEDWRALVANADRRLKVSREDMLCRSLN